MSKERRAIVGVVLRLEDGKQERARNERVPGIQKTSNPFIDTPEIADAIPDF